MHLVYIKPISFILNDWWKKWKYILKAVLDLYQLSNQQSPYSPILIQHVATQGTFSYSSSFLKRAMKFWRNLQVDMRYGLLPCLLQVPKTFVTVQIFWGRPNVWLHLVPLQKLLCWHKNWIYSSFGLAQKIWICSK